MLSPNGVASTLWFVWVVAWVLAAWTSARTIEKLPLESRLAQSLFIWIGGALLFSRWFATGALAWRVLPSRESIAWAGVAAIFAGLAHTVWARVHLGRLWSGSVTFKEGHVIVRSGPYRWTRHPIYTGLVFAVLGTAVLRGTIGASLGVPLVAIGLILKIRQEETLLSSHFGDAYRAYQAAVPMLIPGARPSP